MNKAEAIKSDSYGNRVTGMTMGMGILVTVLMVLSGFAAVLMVGGGVNAAGPASVSTQHSKGASLASSSASSAAVTSANAAPSFAQKKATYDSLMSGLQGKGIASKYIYPPNIMGPGAVQNGNLVTPLYSTAPAPMGIGDFGLVNTTGTQVGTVTRTSSVMGTATLNSMNPFYLLDDGPASVTFQLNTVATNVTVQNSSTGQFWLQDVPFYSARTGQLAMLDNVWNFSSYGAGLPAGTLVGNGTLVAPTYYYDYAPIGVITMPFTVQLYNNVSVTAPANSPFNAYSTTVRFGYNVIKAGASVSSGVFDTVYFNSTQKTAPAVAPMNEINGQQCSLYASPTSSFCLLLDAELMIGGPGGGSTAVLNGINATMSLGLWNATSSTYNNAPSAYDFGTDTGETSVGVGEWWTNTGTVNLDGGPSFLFPMWNASGVTSTKGDMKVTGAVAPSNAFIFFNSGAQNASTFSHSTAVWAPVPASGLATYNLPPGNYTLEALMSNYDPMMATVTATLPTFAFAMTANSSMGIYTPLYAQNNAQVKNISTSGSGTAASPYVVMNQQFQTIAPEFNQINDYAFPIFPGLLLKDTTVYTDINNAAPFSMTYVQPWLGAESFYGGPTTNQLPMETYNATHVSVWGAHSITGWFYVGGPSVVSGFPSANLILWNTTNSLVGDNNFINSGTSASLLVYNPATVTASNTIWGNTFSMNMSAPDYLPYAQLCYAPNACLAAGGITMYSSGNIIYNNIVNTYPTAASPTGNIYNGYPASYTNTWNVSMESSLVVNVVNGYVLSGNIMGYSWQGGNDWYDYTCAVPLPYNEGAYPYTTPGLITNGGDYLPINYPTACAPSASTYYPVTFKETNLTSGLGASTWTVTLDNGMSTTANTSTIVFYLVAGAYNYSASTTVSGYFYAQSMATATVTGTATESVSFSAIPTISVSVTSGLKGGAYTGHTDLGLSVNNTLTASALAAMGFSEYMWVSNLEGTAGSGTLPNGNPCPNQAWFYEGLSPKAGNTSTSVLASTTNVTSLPNFCIPSGYTDLPYGAYAVNVEIDYTVTDPMTGAATTTMLTNAVSTTFFHVYAALTGPSPGAVFAPGNVTISYGMVWSEATSEQIVVTGPAKFSPVTLTLGAGTVSGNVTLVLSIPGTYNVTLALNDTRNVASGWPQAYANATTSFKIVQAPPNVVIVYKNTTVVNTTYSNTTSSFGGLSFGALSAILIVVGIIVGALIGYLFLAPRNPGGKSSSPEPWSGPSGGNKPQ